MTEKIAIQINARDNVVTVVEDASAGDDVQYITPQGPRRIVLLEAVPMGHKAAVCDLAAGDPVVKYNQPIGTASKPIEKGRHVHDHNVRSAVQGVNHED
jgi:altronate dehydratase